jgi:hypothetical protein
VLRKIIYSSLLIACITLSVSSCKTTKQINKAISPKDSTAVAMKSVADSLKLVNSTIETFKSNFIDFRTFSAKIKVEVEGSRGKQPDISATVRVIKDSAIWMSLSATFLGIEVYRILITKDSVILMNKQEKEVQFRSLDYLQEVTEIPFDYKTVENLIIGNPVFYNDSILSFKQFEEFILISTRTDEFKNLLTLSNERKLLLHSKLDDVNVSRSRTADITYSDFEDKPGFPFSTYRQIIASEKNKIDLRLKIKQYEFNKELNVDFHIPRNYTRK